MGSTPIGSVKRVMGKTSYFLAIHFEDSTRYVHSYLMTNRKLHMRFRLTPWSMTLD